MIGHQNTISISPAEPIDNRDKLFFSNFLKSLISFIPGCLVLSIYIYIEIINIDRGDTIKGFISEEAFSIYERKVSYTIITTDMFHQDTAAINYVKAAWRTRPVETKGTNICSKQVRPAALISDYSGNQDCKKYSVQTNKYKHVSYVWRMLRATSPTSEHLSVIADATRFSSLYRASYRWAQVLGREGVARLVMVEH